VRITAEWLAERQGIDPGTLGEALVATYDATFRADGDTHGPT
jgi:hypothetical protein